MTHVRFDSWDPDGGGWPSYRFSQPRATHVATSLEDVRSLVAEVDAAAASGRWAAVAIAYEAAAAFDPAMPRRPAAGDLLAWAAIYDRPDPAPPVGADPPAVPAVTWQPALDERGFAAAIAAIQQRVAAGDTYQVNYTFPLRAAAPEDVEPWYRALGAAQQAGYCALLDLGPVAIVSLSPELFFERRGTRVRTRPMKGTAPRGRWPAEDEARAAELATSQKARAENVMIVDLLRNDLGRVAAVGSVRVPRLFEAERYPTVWQLTSTIEADVPAERSIGDLLDALFPCGSVTGAPKIRTMEIIAAHEPEPRGIYTGAIGLVSPGGDCTFSVAIRTIVVDRATRVARLGVGAGITADSRAHEEYAECLLKGAFAAGGPARPRRLASGVALLETMRMDEGRCALLEGHLDRIEASARLYGLRPDRRRLASALAEAAVPRQGSWRVRLSWSGGDPTIAWSPLLPETGPWRVALSGAPVDDQDPALFNKTTDRRVYDAARGARPDADDVLLWNRRGELTEFTFGNVVVELDGRRWTPPVSCGLLGGVFRAALLSRGEIAERVLTPSDLERATGLWLINAVRGWVPAVFP